MSKQEIAAFERVFQISKEAKMRLWQRMVKGRLDLGDLLAVCQGFGRQPVGDKSFQAAQTQPLIEQTAIT